jgi:hypothetical protein
MYIVNIHFPPIDLILSIWSAQQKEGQNGKKYFKKHNMAEKVKQHNS